MLGGTGAGGASPPNGGTMSTGVVKIGDIEVPRMGFGAMRLTGEGVWGDPPDRDAAIALLRRVRETGVHFIDTADAYGPETNERLIHDALHPYDNVLIATKGGMTRSGPGQWAPDGRPEHLRAACENSVQRLGVERIDLYQLHAPDPDVPYAESIGVLAAMQREGKIHHIGISNVSYGELRTAQSEVTVVSVQNRYNVGNRTSEPVLLACDAEEIAFLPYAPVASGALTTPDSAVRHVAERHGATTSQIALAWLLHHAERIVPIPGTSSMAHFEENIGAANVELTAGDMAELDGISTSTPLSE